MSGTQDIVDRLAEIAAEWPAGGIIHLWDVSDTREEITRLRSLLNDAVAALEEAEDALDNYADGEVIDGVPRGNYAMQAVMEIQDTLAKIKAALPPPAQTEGEA